MRRWIGLAAALLLLNGLLSFDNAWPTAWIVPDAVLSIEALVVTLGLALIGAWCAAGGRRLHRAVLDGIAAAYLVLILGRYIDVTVQTLLGRQLDWYWDLPHVPDLLGSAARAVPGWRLVCGAVLAVAVIWLLWRIVRRALVEVLTTLGAGLAAGHRLAWGVMTALLLAAALALSGRLDPASPMAAYVAAPVTTAFAEQWQRLMTELDPKAVDRLLPAGPPFAGDLSGLAGADMMIVFVESYGATTLDNPAYREALAAPRQQLQQTLDEAGYAVVSARVTSPTFGGGSWLAHAGLLSGIAMQPQRYQLLLTTSRPSLVSFFRQRGYRTVALMPGLRGVWPEGAFYGYDEVIDSRTIDYRGLEFGFWRIPDQFSLRRLDELSMRRTPAQPTLTVFATISSHIPFAPVPPLIEAWPAAGSDDRRHGAGLYSTLLARGRPASQSAASDGASSEGQPQLPPADWDALGPAYVDSIAYSLGWLSAYLRQHADRDLVMVVIGDHQPAASVSGRHASWDVPVHVIAHRRKWLQPLADRGFVDGLLPGERALGAMHELTPMLLETVGQR